MSNLRGYAAAVFEASLHNLLTWARLRRVWTSCTWEKTTVAMSKCGSKIGRFVSGTHMPLWVDMVAREGEWAAFCFVAFVNKDGAKVSERSGGDHASGWQKKMGKMGSQLKNEGSTRFNETGGRR